MNSFFFAFMFALSAAFTGLLGVALLTYVTRTWQLIRGERDESTQQRLLDGIDHVQDRITLVNERLARLEERLDGQLPAEAPMARLQSDSQAHDAPTP